MCVCVCLRKSFSQGERFGFCFWFALPLFFFIYIINAAVFSKYSAVCGLWFVVCGLYF